MAEHQGAWFFDGVLAMRIIGKRKLRTVSGTASGALLKQGALFNDELHKLPTGNETCMRKGVYHYRSHDEANRHWEACLIARMVRDA